MDRGRLVAQGSVSDLIGASGSVYVEVDDPVRARSILEAIPEVVLVTRQGNGLAVEMKGGRRSDLAAALMGRGLQLETIMPTRRLEDAFLHLLNERDRQLEVA
jgi:ABC-2 type transport system ATP-binding protein